MRTFRTVMAGMLLAGTLCVAPVTAQTLPTGVHVAAGITAPPVARLTPSTRYTAVQHRSISGKNAFQEMVPTSSLQDVILETGTAAGGTIPVTLTVFRFRGDAGSNTAPVVDYKVRFDAAADGSIGNLSAETIEGPMPEPMLRRMVLRDLRGLLFLGGVNMHDAGTQAVHVTSVSPRSGSKLVDVAFTVDAPKNEMPAQSSATIETTGSALYDSALGCYVEHSEKEVSTLYVIEDLTGDSKTIRMETTRSWKVKVSSL